MSAGASSRESVRNTEPELVALLLKAGADPNSTDRAGRTPLMFAAAQGRVELVQVLLAGVADVEAKAANGKTAWPVRRGRRSCGCWGRRGRSDERGYEYASAQGDGRSRHGEPGAWIPGLLARRGLAPGGDATGREYSRVLGTAGTACGLRYVSPRRSGSSRPAARSRRGALAGSVSV